MTTPVGGFDRPCPGMGFGGLSSRIQDSRFTRTARRSPFTRCQPVGAHTCQLPLLFSVPTAFVGTFGSTFNALLPVFSPPLAVLACTMFNLRATQYFSDSEILAQSLLANDQFIDFRRMASLLQCDATDHIRDCRGARSGTGSFVIVRALGEPVSFCLLSPRHVSCWSRHRPRCLRRSLPLVADSCSCEVRLPAHRLIPSSTIGIIGIAVTFGTFLCGAWRWELS